MGIKLVKARKWQYNYSMRAKFIHIFRVGFAVLSLTAIIAQLNRHVSYGFSTVNFFSYFTNLSNIFFAVFLLAAGIVGLLGLKHSYLFEVVRGAAALCMLIVGIVFSLLLRNEDLGTLMPWVNIVLHYAMPIVAVVDWVMVPTTNKLTRKHLVPWLIFPTAYLSYTLIRGAAVDWYPYPFLNPTKAGGYLGVTGYCVVIFVLFVFGGGFLLKLNNKQRTHKIS
jgi:hypothetical protein